MIPQNEIRRFGIVPRTMNTL